MSFLVPSFYWWPENLGVMSGSPSLPRSFLSSLSLDIVSGYYIWILSLDIVFGYCQSKGIESLFLIERLRREEVCREKENLSEMFLLFKQLLRRGGQAR